MLRIPSRSISRLAKRCSTRQASSAAEARRPTSKSGGPSWIGSNSSYKPKYYAPIIEEKSVAELGDELAQLDLELDKDKQRLVAFLKNTFGIVPNDADLFVTALTDPSHKDNRLHNRSLYLVGRRFISLLHIDSSVAETLQANPNETLDAPREEDYNRILTDKQIPWFSVVRLQRQLKILGLEPYIRGSGFKRRYDELKQMPAHAFSQNRDVYTKLLAEAMVAFMGALYLDQGDEAARQFFTERVLRYGR